MHASRVASVPSLVSATTNAEMCVHPARSLPRLDVLVPRIITPRSSPMMAELTLLSPPSNSDDVCIYTHRRIRLSHIYVQILEAGVEHLQISDSFDKALALFEFSSTNDDQQPRW
jgi:hypothetical protein